MKTIGRTIVQLPTVKEISLVAANKLQNLDNLKKPTKNKGSRGQLAENVLGLDNTNTLTDCKDGDVKTFTIGQTIFITQLKHCLHDIVINHVPFEDSKPGRKIANCCYIPYSKDGHNMGSYFVSNKTHSHHYKKLAEDYDFICKTIREKYEKKETLSTINGPNKLLQIRTKASKIQGVYPPLMFNGVQLKDKYMAFYIRAKFGKSLVNN